jgi:hypothetical protein
MLHSNIRQQTEFLQHEVVPRRGELYNALRELTAADQRTLQNSEGEFASARRRAAERLLLMLGLGVVFSVLAAGFSIRHAENLERKAERHFAEVEEARRESQQLSARLLEIEEEGRRRLSRELHDEIGQTLALLQIEISHIAALTTAPPAALRARLERAARWPNAPLTVRSISLLLRPQFWTTWDSCPRCSSNSRSSCAARHRLRFHRRASPISYPIPSRPASTAWSRKRCTTASTPAPPGASLSASVSDRLVAEVADNGRGFSIDAQGRPARSRASAC